MTEQLELFNRITRLRVRELTALWWELEGHRKPGRRSIKSELKKIDLVLGDLWSEQMGKFDLEVTLFDYLRQENPTIKESSLNRFHTRINRLFNAAKEWQQAVKVGPYDFTDFVLPRDNPGSLIPKFSETKYRRNRVITPEEFARFMDYAHPEVRRICTVAILTLLRMKDIQLLGDDNLNRALNTLSGMQSKTKVPFNMPAPITVVIMFTEAQIERREYLCDFTGFRNRFTRAVRDSGVRFLFSDLRRSGATQLLLDGVDLRTIQKYLGHASIKMTEVYLAPPVEVSKVAARKLEAAYITRVEIPMEKISLN